MSTQRPQSLLLQPVTPSECSLSLQPEQIRYCFSCWKCFSYPQNSLNLSERPQRSLVFFFSFSFPTLTFPMQGLSVGNDKEKKDLVN
ncbi:hypothetical protein Y1Q_0024224 [Alligator mississippiensis]|uniref:Uncharacterized protein n=1 Tax=Alligator mississippiensis TaxID=8496 RepID=A0A151NI69_ALLMI|nr:hypothetical protein Y1Q_0024224 [Alligator mississippiensis]